MPTQETTLRVPDMECDGCTERVTNVLERLGGVRSARVTLGDKTARVEHDPDAIAPGELQAAVEKAGYTPSLQTA
jgi:Cu+-exporting ATPase